MVRIPGRITRPDAKGNCPQGLPGLDADASSTNGRLCGSRASKASNWTSAHHRSGPDPRESVRCMLEILESPKEGSPNASKAREIDANAVIEVGCWNQDSYEA